MDIGLKTNQFAFRGKKGSMSPTSGEVHRGAQPIREMSKNRINTTASREINNTCGRLSFKGVQSTVAKESKTFAEKVGQKIADSPKIESNLAKINFSRLLTEALFALSLTCVLRPLTILSTPTKSEENKQKNKYQAAKSISTGLVGLGATFLINTPNKKAVDIATQTLRKLDKVIDNDYAGSFADYITQTGLDIKKETPELKDELFKKLEVAHEKMLATAQDKLEKLPYKYDSKAALKKAQKEAENEIKKLEEVVPKRESIDKLLKTLKEKISPENAKNIISQNSNLEGAKKQIITKIKEWNSCRQASLEKAIGPVFFVGKAMLTIALVPVILNALGIKKTNKPKTEVPKEQPQQPPVAKAPQLENINPVFKNIAGEIK